MLTKLKILVKKSIQVVACKYLWHSKVTDVLKVWTDNRQFTLQSLILTPYPLHFLIKKIRGFVNNKKKPTIIFSVWPLFILVHCPLAYYAPMIHHTFWPGLWPAPPGAKPSGSVLLPGPWAPGFSTPPAAVWTPLMHNGHCPATGEKAFILKTVCQCYLPRKSDYSTGKEIFCFYGFSATKTT